MLTITFVQHGNYVGSGPSATLNAKGIEQANTLASEIVLKAFHGNHTAVLSSIYTRAQQTASPIRKSLKDAGYSNVSTDEDVFLILMRGVSLLSPVNKSGDHVTHSAQWLSKLKSSSIVVVSHGENLSFMSAAFAKAGGSHFIFVEGEAVTYQVDAESWAEAVEKGLEGCSKIVWKHGDLSERNLI